MEKTNDIPQAVSDAARALGKLGASAGGRARAAKLNRRRRRDIAKRGAAQAWTPEARAKRAATIAARRLERK